MTKREILQALDLPFPCDFSTLTAMCQDSDVLETMLSLALAQGEKKGMVEANERYNSMFLGYDAVPLSNCPTEVMI